jgi:hypothetical protein
MIPTIRQDALAGDPGAPLFGLFRRLIFQAAIGSICGVTGFSGGIILCALAKGCAKPEEKIPCPALPHPYGAAGFFDHSLLRVARRMWHVLLLIGEK